LKYGVINNDIMPPTIRERANDFAIKIKSQRRIAVQKIKNHSPKLRLRKRIAKKSGNPTVGLLELAKKSHGL
jgi:hypothetical protein